ncbi:MAG: cytochrome c family protein [Polyangiales bacterium]
MAASHVSSASQVQQGTALLARFECARCHQGAGEVSAIKNCTGCHQEILRGEFDADASILARWQERLSETESALIDTLDLGRVRHFRRAWVSEFLTNPQDLRPNLGPMMPRLAVTQEQADLIADALVPEEDIEAIERGDAERGQALLTEGQCGRCHQRGGEALPGGMLEDAESARRAPDLAHVDRWQRSQLVRWLMDPQAMDGDTSMPQTGYSRTDANDVVAFLMTPVPTPARDTAEARLPVLERDVFHDEVESRVFRRLCWHCHGDPDYARSEGGPGNTGGFGFPARRLDLSSYEGIMSGAVNEEGRRYSILFNDEVPRVVEVLLARHREVSSQAAEDIRGMPLGMPPLSYEDIQLVESWVAQGARR